MNKLVTENVIINGNRIAYGVQGSGEPIVLIHGTPSYSHIWRNVIPGLVGAGFKIYVYDLLGFGHSERPHDHTVDTSVGGQVQVLTGLMDHWKIARSHVVAHDIGGAVAQRLGIFHPQRVNSLTLIDCVSFDSWPSKRTREQMKTGLETLMCATDSEHRRHFSQWLLSAVHFKDRMETGPLNAYVDMISGPVGQASLFQHQIMHYDHKYTSQLDDRLSELGNIPTQLIWGADDNWQITDWAKRLQASIPGSMLTILQDCGHFSLEDQPEAIVKLIIDFLETKGPDH